MGVRTPTGLGLLAATSCAARRQAGVGCVGVSEAEVGRFLPDTRRRYDFQCLQEALLERDESHLHVAGAGTFRAAAEGRTLGRSLGGQCSKGTCRLRRETQRQTLRN